MSSSRIAVIALVLAHAGCPKKSTTTTAEPEEQSAGCDTVADRAITLFRQDGEVEGDKAVELRDVLVRLCTDDEWPDGARTCMLDASEHQQLQDCAHQFLSDDSYRRLGTEMERVLDESDDGQIGLPPE